MKENIKSNFSLYIIIPLLLIKCIPFFVEPRIWAEEGTAYLSDSIAYGLSSILHMHQGYYSIIPNVTLYVSSLFNYRYIPYFTFTVSFLFWIILFLLINGINGSYKNNFIFRSALGLGIFCILNSYQEIFMNTINLQFITPIVLFIILIYDFEKLSNFKLNIFFILSSICLMNGALGIFFLPGILYKFISIKNYKQSIAIIFFCFFSLFLAHIFTSQDNPSASLAVRIEKNLLFFKGLSIGSLIIKKLYFILLVFAYYLYSHKKYFLSYAFFTTFMITLFTDFTKIGEQLGGRYLSLTVSLIFIGVFLVLYTFKSPNKVYIIGLCIVIIFFGRTFFKKGYYCKECEKWSKEYINLEENKDAYIHPEGWKIPPIK